MLEKSVVEKCCTDELGKGVVEKRIDKWRRRVFDKRVAKKCCREKCWASQHRQKMLTSAQESDYDRSTSI